MSETKNGLTDALRARVKATIIEALRVKYVSVSSHMAYTTGNAYQALTLDDEAVGGYRQDRSNLFARFDFSGRRVLDCGCNLGELSRLARARGAVLVDGIEYDDYFVQIARLVTAFKGVSRVSFSQGDLTKPNTIKDTYDVTMAFSVFPYILPVLDRIGACTTEALVLETHNISSDILKVYITPVSKQFPYHTFVDYTDFGHGEGKRAVLVFAKRPSTLLGGFIHSTVNVVGSGFSFLDRISEVAQRIAPGRPLTRADLPTLAEGEATDERLLTAGRRYWIEMARGYVQARGEGRVDMGNSYARFLRRMLAETNFDPTLGEKLSSDDALVARVAARFADVDKLAEGPADLGPVEPILVVNPKDAAGKLRIKHGETGNDVFVDVIDGYHRVFWARMFGVKKLPALYVYQ